ncbi:hypothetical protein HO133_001549 [Letharia lupina]|uniref:Dipeptidyl-peptidase V n=1 Tax=Letharia lupina TaxID=560253 RepID=A0A8H6CF80_9LECA|nr:uncharacterized protein HO133_001549 [Letharia lupina]KAF6222463.1 hypothetical protein HO133_001549 [Letharia lupina]
MTIHKITKLTLESFISAPRRSSAVPNENGRLALYTLSIYSLDSHSEGKEIRVLDLENGTTALFSDDSKVKDIQWLGNDCVLWLREAEGGTTEVWSGVVVGEKNAYLIATIDGAASNLKTKRLLNGSFAVTVTGKASLDGSFYNAEKAVKPQSSAREYDTFPVRVWDTYLTAEKSVIWYTVLEKSPENINRYMISQTGFINALQGTNLVHPNPFYGVDSEIGTSGILLNAKDPSVNAVLMEKNSLYFVPLSTFKEDPAPTPRTVSMPGFSGTSGSPTFSHDGKSAAFLQTKDSSNAYDNSSIIIVGNIDSLDHMTEVVTSTSSEKWDLRPESLTFSSDAKELYIIAESRGSKRVFKIQIRSHSNNIILAIPTPITAEGVVSSLHALSPTRLLFTMSTITSPSVFGIIDPSTDNHTCSFSHLHDKPDFGYRPPQVSSIDFKGAGDYKVQAFVIKPSDFSEDKTYPMLFWIHGGPVYSWPNAWSYRWNAAVFAEQGYIVIMPNVTGSTGFGQGYIEGIVGEWGGRAYKDLVNCFEYVKEDMPFVDTERVVAMGGSYGGYMVNWYISSPISSIPHHSVASSTATRTHQPSENPTN